MASLTTNKFRELLMNGGVDLDTDTAIKVMLLTSSYTPDKDHDFVSAISANEVTLPAAGYVGGFAGSGRKTLASKTVVKDNTTDVAYFDAADVTWTAIGTGSTIVGYAAVIKEITNDAASPVLVIVDLTPDVTLNGGDFTIQWAAPPDGICKIS